MLTSVRNLLLFQPQSAAAPAFTPASIAGLKLWLKADAGTYQNTGLSTPASADGDPVGGWADQSSTGNNVVQATGANRPALKLAIRNGLPVLRFNGTNNVLQILTMAGSAMFGSTDLTVFAAFVPNNSGTDFGLFEWTQNGTGSTNDRVEYLQLGSNLAWDFGNTYSRLSFAQPGGYNAAWHVTTMQFSSGATNGQVVYVDGTAQGQQTSTNSLTLSDTHDFSVGADISASRYLQGDIGELLIYNSSLSTAQRQQVEGYLKTRWATP